MQCIWSKSFTAAREYLFHTVQFTRFCLSWDTPSIKKASKSVGNLGYDMNERILFRWCILIGTIVKTASIFAPFWMMLQGKSLQPENSTMKQRRTLLLFLRARTMNASHFTLFFQSLRIMDRSFMPTNGTRKAMLSMDLKGSLKK